MGLLFRIALVGLFCLGAYRVSLAQPQTFERPEALAGMAIIAMSLWPGASLVLTTVK